MDERFQELETVRIEPPLRHIGALLETPMTSLTNVYLDGWWITEIFGSKAILVAKTKHFYNTRPTFKTATVFIDTTTLTPKTQRLIKKIANEHWKLYKRYMLTKKFQTYRMYDGI